ncbi:MAG: ABC transporter permease [Azospirillaceae bacterium]|nr:ABC transporter permease [Azospirillaceae bacterium]
MFGIWQAAAEIGWLPDRLLPRPSSLPVAWIGEIEGGYWQAAVLDSLSHYTIGLLIGSLLGAALGICAGTLGWLDAGLGGIVRLLRPIPGLAWVPFAILWFGLGSAGAVFVIAISVFWINFYAAHAAVQAVDRDLLEVADAFGHGHFWGRVVKILLPASAPGLLAGFRTGLGQAWMSVVAAELFGVPGIGARMMQASSLLATDLVLIYMLTMALLYAMTDTVFVLIRRRVLAWQN